MTDDARPGRDDEAASDVTLVWSDGREVSLAVAAGETVLNAAERADAGLPFGCTTGACGTCVARLLDGEVSHRRQSRALKDRHLDDGYVLTCIAEPETDCRLAVGAEKQAELVDNPWK